MKKINLILIAIFVLFAINSKAQDPKKDFFGKSKHYVLQRRKYLFFWEDNQYVTNDEESHIFLNSLNNKPIFDDN